MRQRTGMCISVGVTVYTARRVPEINTKTSAYIFNKLSITPNSVQGWGKKKKNDLWGF